jgi:NADH:ubiquinone oxidoreductase subunit 2 (chain N)
MSGHTGRFGISAKLQEIMCLLSQGAVFEESEEVLRELIGVEISAKQFQRVSEHYGNELEELESSYQSGDKYTPELSVDKEEPVYVMVDGSMVLTREDSWKEIKVGRLYSESARVSVQKDRTEVADSLYVCTLGNNKDFFRKLEPYVDCYSHKIIIADGAKWIWNWADDFYGDAIQILDFFHAVEKLGAYACLAYKDEQERNRWMEQQTQRLKNDQVESLTADLKNIQATTTQADKALKDVIAYYQSNIKRMKYKTFLHNGYLIGSGAIESAHRNVIQQRMKLSGQRWSKDGAQRIANLRACKKSKTWKILLDCIINAA